MGEQTTTGEKTPETPLDEERAVWSAAKINDLPDAAFAVIEPGGEKDEEGKTVPRSLRHLPHHGPSVRSATENASVDRPHLANALSRLAQTKLPEELRKKAEAHLRRHAAGLEMGEERGAEDELSRAISFGVTPEELRARREAFLKGGGLRLGVLRREAGAASITAIDVEKRTVEMTWSSERPVERWFGTEVLDHSPGSVRLDRLRRGGPVLLNHNPEKQVGVVEDVGIGTDRRGWARIRLGRSALAEETLQDVADKIKQNVSTGYRVYRLRKEDKPASGGTGSRSASLPAGAGGEAVQFRGTDWEPLELSLMSVAEDYTVGVGRGVTDEEIDVEVEGIELTRSGEEPQDKTTVESPREDEEEIETMGEQDLKAKLQEERAAERDRISAILAVGEKFDQKDLARKFIEEDRGVAEMHAAVLEVLGKEETDETITRGAPENTEEEKPNPAFLDLPEKELGKYSLFRAIHAYLEKDWKHAGLEREVSLKIADRLDRAPNGFYVPNDVMVDPQYLTRGLTPAAAAYIQLARVLEIGGGASAEPLRGTAHLAGSFIELLRARNVLMQAGARVLDGLVGDQDIPRQSGGATTAWVAEGGAPGLADPSFNTLTLSPKTVGAATSMTRRALKQSSPAVEGLVRDDLNRAVARAIDIAGLRGTGAGNNQPQGVVGASGVGDVEFGSDGAAASWLKVIEFETDVADANADEGSLAYVTTPKGRGHFKGKPVEAGTAVFMWERDNTMNGYRAFATKNLRDTMTQGGGSNLTEVLYGNWADLLIAMWGAFDLKPDEATLVTSGGLVLRAFQDIDVGIRHAASFSYSDDLNTAA